jgi:ribosome biogenesis GTPase / thiamine phosphate phosphatase
MSSVAPGALAAYGWSDRVATLFHSEPAVTSGRTGRVTRVERGAIAVIDGSGVERMCASTGVPAVGDWVVVDGQRLAAVLPRWSCLDRRDPETGRAQVLAANVDLVLVTVPGDRPNSARAERELLIAWESGARPMVVMTKADLATRGLLDEMADRLAGVDVIATSAETGAGVAEVAAILAPDLTGVLLGPSGAGKSRLTNALLGEQRQATGEVRADDRRGRHTTTSRQLLPLPGGGVIIDTPGLRSLGVLSAGRLDRAFPDIDALATGCRFADCAHDVEPGCAVIAAVVAGDLPRQRLASYNKLGREAAAERQRTDPLERRAVKRVWKQRTMDARRNDKRIRPHNDRH